MKRYLCILLAAMCLSNMVGCGENANKQAPPTTVTEAQVTATAEATETPMPETPAPTQKISVDRSAAMAFTHSLSNGWNLGNTLDAVGSLMHPQPIAHEIAMGNPVTTEEMIKLVKEAGFGTLRIPVTWMVNLGEAPEYKIDDPWLDRVEEVVNYGLNNDLTVILNAHHEFWIKPREDKYEKVSAQLSRLWQQVAERFNKYDNRLIFEGMNEPRLIDTELEWTGGDTESRGVINKLNQVFVETVRRTGGNNATRMLMIPTYAAATDEAVLNDFTVPDDPNIIVSLHAYTPYPFALQPEGVEAWSSKNPEDTKDVDALFERIDRFFISKGIPVIIGETGARNRGNLEARVDWAQYFSVKAQAMGVPLIWWDNGTFTGNGERLGLLDRRGMKWEFIEIINAFQNKLEENGIE